jgi:lipid II:glycine glycyltransferase (peptidoglycan interpeptide bridge formation enzyme)
VIRKEFRGLQPLAKILFHSMVDAAKEGRQRWNWGGTWKTQKGVYQFKKKWGAKDFQYSYYVTLNNPELLHLSPEDLRKNYPGFYLLPYDRLYVGGAVS